MQLRVCRSATVATVVAALAAAAAGSAQAAVVPTTGAVTAVTPTTATLNGTVSTSGKLTQWVFAYAEAGNAFLGGFSSGGIIPSGTTSPTAVVGTATNLMPSTTYNYYLTATDVTFGVSYYLLSPQYGLPLQFTTKGPGTASLASTKLKVKKGKVAVTFKCSPALACSGGAVTITTHHKHKNISCGSSSSFSVAAGKKKTLHLKVGKKCASLLSSSPKGIKGKLSATFTYQKAINKTVKIKLA